MTGRTVRIAVSLTLALVLAVGAIGCGDQRTKDAAESESPRPGSEAGPWSGAESIRAKRYCEILAVSPSATGLEVQVYSTFPLNDCPDDLWRGLDPATLAAETGAPFALANGPRYWTIDAVSRTTSDDIERREFGGLAMNRYATVSLPGPQAVSERYMARSVDRKAIMTFFAGRQVYVLIDPEGAEYVMQSWSQQLDAGLDEADLASLGERLALPAGWRFEPRLLDADLVIEFGERPAQVLQDDLLNTYSLMAP
jgi:hypothetical protein